MYTGTTIKLRTGHEMPAIGLGTWQLDYDTAGTVEDALGLGYRMIDTSGDYGTQPGIRDGIRNSNIDRNDIFVVTKVEEYENPPRSIRRSLEELGLDFVDMAMLHRPPRFGAGVELWDGLIEVKKDGLAKDIGVSNYMVEHMEALVAATGEVPAVNQIEWSPFGHCQEMFEYCRKNEIIIQAYSPVTRGIRLEEEVLKSLAATYQKSPAQIMLRWNVQLGTAPLPKANRYDHLQENIDIFDFEIGKQDMIRLGDLNENYSSLGRSLQYV